MQLNNLNSCKLVELQLHYIAVGCILVELVDKLRLQVLRNRLQIFCMNKS